jgi:hypothetical protein
MFAETIEQLKSKREQLEGQIGAIDRALEALQDIDTCSDPTPRLPAVVEPPKRKAEKKSTRKTTGPGKGRKEKYCINCKENKLVGCRKETCPDCDKKLLPGAK